MSRYDDPGYAEYLEQQAAEDEAKWRESESAAAAAEAETQAAEEEGR